MIQPASGYPNSRPSDEPLYNIGVVARMTAIPVATLRVWERRYNFPESSRTSGGHRLYSEREVLRLRWVKARIDEGMQTGRAISALRHLEQENRLPEAPFSGLARPVPEIEAGAVADGSPESFRTRLTGALLDHNLNEASLALADALTLYALERVLLEAVGPALVAIGQAWHDGRITVATEHLATNFLRNRMLQWMTSGPAPQGVPPVVLSCAPDEWHESSLLMFGVLLRRRGWPVAYLGQALPLPDLAAFVAETRPDVVTLVAMTAETAAGLLDWPRHLPGAQAHGTPIICFAGGAFADDPVWQQKVPGMYLGDTLQDGVETMDRLLRGLYHLPA